MKNIHPIIFLLIVLTIHSCRDGDPGGKFTWFIVGFPILGIGFFIYEALFDSNNNCRKNK